MFAKARLDTLSDSIFAVAMTLLALDVRLPDNFEPHDGGELIAALINLWPKLLPYVVSFGVLGLRWLSNIQVRSHADHVNREYVKWWLLYLLLITCVPFSTMVVGRYARLAPSIWLYAGHTLLIALIGFRMVRITPHLEQGDHLAGTADLGAAVGRCLAARDRRELCQSACRALRFLPHLCRAVASAAGASVTLRPIEPVAPIFRLWQQAGCRWCQMRADKI